MKKKKNEEFSYELLSDIPLKIDQKQEAKFGHDQIAEVISDIIIKIKPPFTIGLFGKWGTGKSTILNFIESNLVEKDIKTITFDVWKYDDDSLRRQFLIRLDEELNLGLNYKKILNQSLSIPYELKFSNQIRLSLRSYWYRGGWFFLIIFFSFLFIKIFDIYWIIDKLFSTNRVLFDNLYDVSLFSVFITYLFNATQYLYGNVTEMRTDSAEGFEDRFYMEVLPKIKGNKLLIIIDNLDRTTHEKAVNLLSDIKTFFGKDNDNNKAVFLIACDEEAIKRHLEKSNFDNPSEFLRKFFNTSVRIPKFLGEELDEYTRDLLKLTKVKGFEKNSELEWLLTYTYRDNPREIKQIINTLISHYLLAQKAEDTGHLTKKGSITDKPEVLAKVIIIQQRFPNIYKHLEYLSIEKGKDWDDIETRYEEINKSFEDEGKQRLLRKEEIDFLSFIRSTRHIEIDNLLIYIKLQQSPQEQKLPNLPSYIIAAEGRKIEEAKDIFNKTLKNEIVHFDNALKSHIRRSRQGNNLPRIMLISFTTIQAATEDLSKLPKFLQEFALSFPSNSELINYLADFPPFNTYTHFFQLVTNKVLLNKYLIMIKDSYMSLLNIPNADETTIPQEHVVGLFELFSYYKEDFLKQRDIISKKIEDLYSEYTYLNIFVKNKALEFITKEIIITYINTIDQTRISEQEYINNNLNLILKLNLKEVIHPVIQKFTNIINYEGQQGFRPDNRILLMDHLYLLLNDNDRLKKIFDISEAKPNTIEKLTEILINWYQEDTSHLYRIKCVKCIDKLIQLPGNAYTSSGKDKVEDFIRGWSSPDTIKEIDHNRLDIYVAPLNDAIQRLPDIFDEIYKNVAPELNDGFLINLFNKNPEIALKKIELAKNNVKHKDIILNHILNQFGQIDIDIKEKYIDLISKEKGADNQTVIEKFYELLISMKETRQSLVEKYAKEEIFNKAQKENLLSGMDLKEDIGS